MTRAVIIHAVIEMLVLSSVTVFLNRRIKAGEDVIKGLKKQVDNLQSTVNTMQKNMDHLYAILEQMSGPPMPMMMPQPSIGIRHRRPQMMPIPPQPQPEPPQPQQQEIVATTDAGMGDMMQGMGGMMQGLLSAMGGMMPPMGVVQISSTLQPQQQKPKVEITEDDDNDPKVQEALNQLLSETIQETSGLKAEEEQQVNAQ